MKAYVCDSCGKVITNPYNVRMREYVSIVDGKRKVKVHLCADCFKSLGEIARKVESR